jgi:hypothetical protein
MYARTYTGAGNVPTMVRFRCAQDTETELPDPFDFWPWVEAHRAELDAGHAVNLFEVCWTGGPADCWTEANAFGAFDCSR